MSGGFNLIPWGTEYSTGWENPRFNDKTYLLIAPYNQHQQVVNFSRNHGNANYHVIYQGSNSTTHGFSVSESSIALITADLSDNLMLTKRFFKDKLPLGPLTDQDNSSSLKFTDSGMFTGCFAILDIISSRNVA